jgi:VWFA-related protein
MFRSRRLALVTVAVAIAALAIAGSWAEDQQKPSTVIRAASQLVQVNLIAVDRGGNPVTDLTPGDLILTDDNEPQKISLFHLQKNEPVTGRAERLPQGTFSNHAEGVRNVTVILLDNLNLDSHAQPADQIAALAYAKGEARKFLHNMAAQDQIALYAMTSEVRVLHDFTNDSQALLRALDAYRPSPPMADYTPNPDLQLGSFGHPGRSPGGTSLRQREEQLSSAEEDAFFISRRVDDTVADFQAIASHLANIPGRKNIVWLTTGFPFAVSADPTAPEMRFNRPSETLEFGGHPITSMSPQMQKAARAFNNANMAIYPVDIRGLMTSPAFSANAVTFKDHPYVSIGQTEITSMKDIAERTGGRAFYETNGITEAIQAAASDARVTYLLGYYAADTRWDGKFHNIKIKTTRPGVTLRYRRGYFALPPEQPGKIESGDVFAPAIWSPLDATSLGLTVRARRRSQGTSEEALLALHIDPQNVHLENLNGRWVGEIELVVVNLSPTGHNLKGFDQTRKFNFLPSTYERIEREGLEFPLSLRIPNDTEQIRLVVQDSPSGAMGSVTIPLSQVPKT